MPLGSGTNFAGFTIVRLLGSGGMGEVYLAEHPRLPRQDALKILPSDVSADSDFRERFNREADLAATLYHPHIVGVHDRGEFNGQLWTPKLAEDVVEGDGLQVAAVDDVEQLGVAVGDGGQVGVGDHDLLGLKRFAMATFPKTQAGNSIGPVASDASLRATLNALRDLEDRVTALEG